MQILDLITDERRQAADLIESLNPEQLATPSLCTGWSVHQVAAHLLAPLVTPGPMFLWAVVRSGFSLHRANTRVAAPLARRPAAEIAADLRAHAGHPFKPPVVGYFGPFTDLLVHTQDIRRPLGIAHQFPPDRLRVSLDFLVSGKAKGFTPAWALHGTRYDATDVGWSWGSGPLVRGPGEAIMLLLTGRGVALADVDGDGVARLRARLAGQDPA